MRYEVSADIDAAAERVWSVLVDVERMPMWTSSMTRVERLEGGPFGMGSRIRIKQPRLPVAVWRVCELTPLSSFSWVTTRGGVTTCAGHTVAGGGSGVRVTFTVEQNGLLAPLVGLLTSALTRRYVNAELNGLKLRSESRHFRDSAAASG